MYRLIPTIISSAILLFNKEKFLSNLDKNLMKIYLRIAYIVLIFAILILLYPESSTIIDRFSIYLCPLTIFIFNKTIDLKFMNISKIDYHLIFLSSYFVLSFFWLEFASHKEYFVPYKNFLFL